MCARDLQSDDAFIFFQNRLLTLCQNTTVAKLAGAKAAVIVGGLLHDVGWKLVSEDPSVRGAASSNIESARGQWARPPESNSVAEKLGILRFCGVETADSEQMRAQHDVIGAMWLRMMGFDEVVAHVTEGHVLAKRYLTFKEEGYYDKLSTASKRTLEFQGGSMSAKESAIFEADALFETCIEMRKWDEGAKRPDWEVPGLDSYVPLIRECIVSLPLSAAPTTATFLRDGNSIVGVNTVAVK